MADIINQQRNLDHINWQPYSQDSARVIITQPAETFIKVFIYSNIVCWCRKLRTGEWDCSDDIWFNYAPLCRPPTAWTLHPPAASPAPAKVETVEKKIPKGVPLQFDINSVGKPVRACCLDIWRLKVNRTILVPTSQSVTPLDLISFNENSNWQFRSFQQNVLTCLPVTFLSSADVNNLEWPIPYLKGSALCHDTK